MRRMHTQYLVVCVVFLLSAAVAGGDSITIDGERYTDVLVYESPSMYFVKIPDEGRVISAPKSKVDASTVSINDDPFYRDRLRVQYEKVEAEQGQQMSVGDRPLDPAFDVPEPEGGFTGGGDGSAGGAQGGARGLGFPRQMVVGALSQQGFTFNGGSGRSGDGSITVELQGPEDNVTGIVVQITATQAEMGKLFQGMQQVGALMGGIAPWSGQWITQNIGQLQGGQAIQRTQDGVFVSVAPSQSGQNVSVTFTVRGA